jgi:hypothetical protein
MITMLMNALTPVNTAVAGRIPNRLQRRSSSDRLLNGDPLAKSKSRWRVWDLSEYDPLGLSAKPYRAHSSDG